MDSQNQYLHEVAITAIIVKNGKYLITKRSPNKKRWPNLWTVPGGRLVISCMADWKSGEVKLQETECDEFAWVSLEEARNHTLIDGIYDELAMTENRRRGKKSEWQRSVL